MVSSAALTAQRFTFAHEIGHYVIHTNVVSFRDRSLSSPDSSRVRAPEEREADIFAAELLMPRKYVCTVFLSLFGGEINTEAHGVELFV